MIKDLNENYSGEQKWNTVLINPGSVEILDENKKTIIKAKNKERISKKQEKEIDPKIIPKEKTKIYDPRNVKPIPIEKDEEPDPIIIVNRQEITNEICETISSKSSPPVTERKVFNEKFVNDPDKYIKNKPTSPKYDEKVEKPEFKIQPGKEYVEKQKITTYMTEIVSPKSKLTPLENRDEYLFPNQEAEKGFKNNERRLVQERREQYSKKEKTKIREVITTNTNERRLRATVVIQKWFKNRQSIIARKTLTERPDGLSVVKHEKNVEINVKPTNLSESLQENEENKRERQKLQTSLSMSQGIRENSYDSPPFKNTILADSLSKSSKKDSKTEISEFFKTEKEKPNKSDSRKKNVVISQSIKQKDKEEKDQAILNRRKTAGNPLKKKKKSARFDSEFIRDIEKKAAQSIQIYFRYFFRKKGLKKNKAIQVSMNPLNTFQFLKSLNIDPKDVIIANLLENIATMQNLQNKN